MTTYYDTRAQRAVAGAEADARRADAEARRADTALRYERERWQLDAERARAQRQADSERADADQARRAEHRRARAEARAARRVARRETLTAAAAGARARLPVLVGAVAIGSPMLIAWGGQYAFAHEVMELGAASITLPIALEGAVLYSAYLTGRAVAAGLPAGRYRAMTWTMTAVAAGMNAWHQIDARATDADPWAGLHVGVIYAVASIVGIVLWELATGLGKHARSGRSGTEIRAAAWQRVRYPRLSWAAASIRAARGASCSDGEAWQAAWIDRYGVGPDAPRRERALARTVATRQHRADRRAARKGEIGMVGGLMLGRPLPPVLPADLPAVDGPGRESVPAIEASTATAVDVRFDPTGVPADLPAESAPPPVETAPGILALAPVPDELFGVAADRYAEQLAAGTPPPLTRIKKDLRVGQTRAARILAYLELLART